MGLVKIAKSRVAGMSPMQKITTVETGFTTSGYPKWITEAYLNNSLLCKSSSWLGGMSVSLPSGGEYTFGVEGKPYSSNLQKSRHALDSSTFYMVVPLTEGEYSALEKNKTVTASYPNVLFGCLWDSVHINRYDTKVKDYGNIGNLMQAYMRDAGCRAPKYAVCEVKGAGLLHLHYLIEEMYAFNNLLLSKGGAKLFGLAGNSALRKELTQYGAALAHLMVCKTNLWSSAFAASLDSIHGTGKFTITPAMLKGDLNCVDVSKGTFVPCNISV
jgi:hypothetical protein